MPEEGRINLGDEYAYIMVAAMFAINHFVEYSQGADEANNSYLAVAPLILFYGLVDRYYRLP